VRLLPLAALPFAVLCTVSAQRPSLGRLLEAAGSYAERYHQAFTTIVAEEHYVQNVVAPLRSDSGTWALQSVGDGDKQRTLRSDVMLLRGVTGEDAWFFFRDVFEVDGKPVSSTRGRLEAWFRQSRDSFVHRARALALEQARFNLGDILRTINVPLIALEFLLPRHQERFRFRLSGDTVVSGIEVTAVTYEERRRPTMIRTPDGDDIEARGTFWIEPGSGRVRRTELRTGERNPRQVRAAIVVTYERNERLDMLVPVSMQERYSAGSQEITGLASYSNFRRFETDVRIIR
jgi:hypothetical protein